MNVLDNDIIHTYNRYEDIGFRYMCQHFLLSKKARTLSLGQVLRLSDDEAYAAFKEIRFSGNGGEPFCASAAEPRFTSLRPARSSNVGLPDSLTSGISSLTASWRSATFSRPLQFS